MSCADRNSSRRWLVVLAVPALALMSASASATETDLPSFTLRISPSVEVTPGAEVTVEVSAESGASLFGHPLDRLVGLFSIDDLDQDLRPTPDASYVPVELHHEDAGRFVGHITAPEPAGDYAVVPFPDVAAPILSGSGSPEPVRLTTVSSVPAPRAGDRPIGAIVLGILLVAVAIPVAITHWAKRREVEVDDYFDREFRDPPTMGGIWTNGGGFGT